MMIALRAAAPHRQRRSGRWSAAGTPL